MSDQTKVVLVQAGNKKTFRISPNKTVQDVLTRAGKSGFTVENVTVREGPRQWSQGFTQS